MQNRHGMIDFREQLFSFPGGGSRAMAWSACKFSIGGISQDISFNISVIPNR